MTVEPEKFELAPEVEGSSPPESDFWLRLVPGGGAETPTLWWSAARFMQGARRFEELQAFIGEAAASWTGHPRVGLREGNPDVEIKPLTDEFFNTLPEASSLASEVVLHFRAALDSAVYQLAWQNTRIRPSGTMFPFCRNSDAWSKRVRADLKGLASAEISAIKAIQPFMGTKWASNLAELSNRDKHDHTLEIAAIYTGHVDPARRANDPTDPGFTQFQVTESKLAFVFVPVDRNLDGNNQRIVTDELIEIMTGITEFLNPLLDAGRVSRIRLHSQV